MNAIPTTFVVSANGTVVYRHDGAINAPELTKVLGIIEELKIDAPVHHSHEHCAFCHSGYGAMSIGRLSIRRISFWKQGIVGPKPRSSAVALGDVALCGVCNQSIEDSEVEMAQTLRRFVRERLGSGSRDNIRAELIRSYGQFVSYEPAKSGFGWLLWASPWLILMIAGGAIFLVQRRRRPHV